MDPSDQQQQQHHQGATATKAPGFPPSPPQHHHQRRRSALEGAAAASPLVVGPGGIALLRLGGTGSPARLRSGSAGSGIGIGTGGSVDSPTRAAAVAGPLGGSSPLSSYALRVMRERAAAAAATSATAGGKGGGGDGASAAVEEKGDYSVLSSGHQGTRRSSTSVGDGKARLSSLSYAAGAPSPPSANKSPAAPVRIRSVEEDDEDGEETPAAHGGCGHACGGDGHHGLSTVASASGSGSGSSSSSSGSMCCRNCGSSEVVKKVPLSASSPSKGDGGLAGPNTTAALRAASLASGLPVSTCKLLVVGNAKCGKTSVIRRFVQGSFENAYVSTVGADYLKRDVVLKDGRPVRLQLWDIAGQDRFVHLTRAYFARAKGVLLVCDLTREKTFEAVRAWKKEIDEWALTETKEGVGPLPVVLIANKCDMLTDPADSFLAGANMVAMCHEQNFASWYVTSARTGSNVESAFLDLVERAVAFSDQQDKAAAAAGAAAVGNGFKLSSADGAAKAGSGSGGSAWSLC